VATGDRTMKQQLVVEETTTTSEEQMSADYLLLHTAFKAGEHQRRRLQAPSSADRRQSVPRIHVDDDSVDQPHRRTHSLKCSSSSSPTTRRQSASTCRRAVSVKSTPPRSARSISNASPKVDCRPMTCSPLLASATASGHYILRIFIHTCR